MPAFSFNKYKEVKNRYCLKYLGNQEVFIKQLLIARRIIEDHYKELEIYLCVDDKMRHTICDHPRTICQSTFVRKDYAYWREISYNMKDNPVIQLLEESGIAVNSDTKKLLDA